MSVTSVGIVAVCRWKVEGRVGGIVSPVNTGLGCMFRSSICCPWGLEVKDNLCGPAQPRDEILATLEITCSWEWLVVARASGLRESGHAARKRQRSKLDTCVLEPLVLCRQSYAISNNLIFRSRLRTFFVRSPAWLRFNLLSPLPTSVQHYAYSTRQGHSRPVQSKCQHLPFLSILLLHLLNPLPSDYAIENRLFPSRMS